MGQLTAERWGFALFPSANMTSSSISGISVLEFDVSFIIDIPTTRLRYYAGQS